MDKSRHRVARQTTRLLAGGSLIEVLIVLLMVSLMAAVMMRSVMEKTAQLETAASEAGAGGTDLAGLLAQLTSDPTADRPPPTGDSARQQGASEPLDTESERREYAAVVDELEHAGRLEEWKRLLRERLGADHPLLAYLDAPAETAPRTDEPVVIRRADDPAAAGAAGAGDGDADIRWADGEPVRFIDDRD